MIKPVSMGNYPAERQEHRRYRSTPKGTNPGNTGNTRITVTDYCGALIQRVCGSYTLTLSLESISEIYEQTLFENDYYFK